jgi:hypothetical protein
MLVKNLDNFCKSREPITSPIKEKLALSFHWILLMPLSTLGSGFLRSRIVKDPTDPPSMSFVDIKWLKGLNTELRLQDDQEIMTKFVIQSQPLVEKMDKIAY